MWHEKVVRSSSMSLNKAAMLGDESALKAALLASGWISVKDLGSALGVSQDQQAGVGDALRLAAQKERLGCLEMLLGFGPSQADVGQAMLDAAMMGSVKAVEALAPRCEGESAAFLGKALGVSAMLGAWESVEDLLRVGASVEAALGALELLAGAPGPSSTKIARRLIALCDPTANESRALERAASAGRSELVRELIPVSDPMARGCVAIKSAARFGSVECVRMLASVSNLKEPGILTEAFEGEREGSLGAVETASFLLESASECEIRELARKFGEAGASAGCVELARGYLKSLDERRELSETTSAASDGARGARGGVRVRLRV